MWKWVYGWKSNEIGAATSAQARLAAEDGSAAVDRLSMSYAPATLTVLECDVEAWDAVKPYANVARAVHETTEYNADDRPTRWM